MTRFAAAEAAISTLANTMRIYGETHVRFGGLVAIDREEAINNLDRAFEAKLEAFHTLYDVSKTEFPYLDYGDTSLLIAVRNAIHHRDHPLFQSLYARLFLGAGPTSWHGASFLLASHPTLHDGGGPARMNHFIRLDDMDARLCPTGGSLHRDMRLKGVPAERRFSLIDRELALGGVRAEALRHRYPADQVYLDLMPVFMSAVARIFKAMKAAGVGFRGYDADVYSVPFTTEIEIDLQHPTFSVFKIGS